MANAMAMMSGTCFVSGRIMEKTMGLIKGQTILSHSRLPSAVAKYNQRGLILNQRTAKGLAPPLGLGAAAFLTTSLDAQAAPWEIAQVAEAATNNDNRGLLVLFVLVPAVLWVLFNILQPALNQLDRMKST